MTNEQIDELLALEAKATPGPWEFNPRHCCFYEDGPMGRSPCSGPLKEDWVAKATCYETEEFLQADWPTLPKPEGRGDLLAVDAALIAAARNCIRPLAEEVKRLRETWRCFHCGFETSDKTEAAGHFGEYGEEHPLCIVWGQLSDQEKINELQKIAGQLAKSEEENRTLRSTIEGLEYRVDGVAAEIFSRFKGCRTIDEAWHNYDFMEGRALAAEEEVKRLRAAKDDIQKATAELKARAPMRTIFHDDGQIVTVTDRVED